LPGWLDEDFKTRLKLSLRHEEDSGYMASFDCVRSEAYVQLGAPFWVSLFESLDPGVTGQTVEIRHPFFDLRLMSFLLALPPVPWCVDKEILRAAMLDRLPKAVRIRPKTPLRGFPVYEQIVRSGLPGLNKLASTNGLARFVNKERFLKMMRNPKRLLPGEEEMMTRPLGLAIWLCQVEKSKPVTGGN
jgi:asparagine synthase (glutamine-hydrolysing)